MKIIWTSVPGTFHTVTKFDFDCTNFGLLWKTKKTLYLAYQVNKVKDVVELARLLG